MSDKIEIDLTKEEVPSSPDYSCDEDISVSPPPPSPDKSEESSDSSWVPTDSDEDVAEEDEYDEREDLPIDTAKYIADKLMKLLDEPSFWEDKAYVARRIKKKDIQRELAMALIDMYKCVEMN